MTESTPLLESDNHQQLMTGRGHYAKLSELQAAGCR
jgi:ABC-type multidrug transport system fused ATPase/permease subunit